MVIVGMGFGFVCVGRERLQMFVCRPAGQGSLFSAPPRVGLYEDD